MFQWQPNPPRKTERFTAIKEQYKLMLIGDSGVGKTSIFNHYLHRTPTQSPSTLDFSKRVLTFNEQQILLTLWDTAGQSQFQTIISSSLKSTQGVLLVFDQTCQQSWLNLKNTWLPLVKSKAPDAICMVIGNKCDLAAKVLKEQVTEWARFNQFYFVQTSAISGKNIEQAFFTLAAFIFKKHQNQVYDRRMKKYQTMKVIPFLKTMEDGETVEEEVLLRKFSSVT